MQDMVASGKPGGRRTACLFMHRKKGDRCLDNRKSFTEKHTHRNRVLGSLCRRNAV